MGRSSAEACDLEFFAAVELHRLLHDVHGLAPVLLPRAASEWREPIETGQWVQWECAYRRPA